MLLRPLLRICSMCTVAAGKWHCTQSQVGTAGRPVCLLAAPCNRTRMYRATSTSCSPLQVVISITNDVSAMFTSFDKVQKLDDCTIACVPHCMLRLKHMQHVHPCWQRQMHAASRRTAPNPRCLDLLGRCTRARCRSCGT